MSAPVLALPVQNDAKTSCNITPIRNPLIHNPKTGARRMAQIAADRGLSTVDFCLVLRTLQGNEKSR